MNNKPIFLNVVDEIMVKKIPTAKPSDTVSHALNLFANYDWDDVHSICVISEQGMLLGIVPINKLLASEKTEKLTQLMEDAKVTAYPHLAQDKVVLEAIKKDVRFIPVVDSDNRFLGAITSDQIIDMLHRERKKHAGTLLKMVGIHGDPTSHSVDDYFKSSIAGAIRARIPFLIIGLIGGVLAAQIIGGFEAALEKQIILAAFIPTIVYMADAIGTQTETIFVRNVSLDNKMKIWRFLTREVWVGMGVAIICGVLISIYSLVRYHSPYLGFVLGLSLLMATFFAIILGTFTPWLIYKLKRDPAIGTGPLSTILQDLASVTAYFMIATALMSIS